MCAQSHYYGPWKNGPIPWVQTCFRTCASFTHSFRSRSMAVAKMLGWLPITSSTSSQGWALSLKEGACFFCLSKMHSSGFSYLEIIYLQLVCPNNDDYGVFIRWNTEWKTNKCCCFSEHNSVLSETDEWKILNIHCPRQYPIEMNWYTAKSNLFAWQHILFGLYTLHRLYSGCVRYPFTCHFNYLTL